MSIDVRIRYMRKSYITREMTALLPDPTTCACPGIQFLI